MTDQHPTILERRTIILPGSPTEIHVQTNVVDVAKDGTGEVNVLQSKIHAINVRKKAIGRVYVAPSWQSETIQTTDLHMNMTVTLLRKVLHLASWELYRVNSKTVTRGPLT